jgi:hypothetical protein
MRSILTPHEHEQLSRIRRSVRRRGEVKSVKKHDRIITSRLPLAYRNLANWDNIEVQFMRLLSRMERNEAKPEGPDRQRAARLKALLEDQGLL